jgi:hypothetical protein
MPLSDARYAQKNQGAPNISFTRHHRKAMPAQKTHLFKRALD